MFEEDKLRFTEDDLSIVYFDDEKAYLTTGYGKHALITKKEAEQLKQHILYCNRVTNKLKEEYVATLDLIGEGEPFLMSREHYLDILENILEKSK